MSFLTDSDIRKIVARVGGATAIGADDMAMIATDLAVQAQKTVKDFLGWGVEQATYTEFLPVVDNRLPESPLEARSFGSISGDGNQILATDANSELFLSQKYVRSVTSVYENASAFITDPTNGDFSAGFLLTAGNDYTIDWSQVGLSESGILRRNGTWPVVARSVKVTYVAGLTAGELATDEYAAIREAAMMTTAFWYLDVRSYRTSEGAEGFGPLTAESLGDWSVSYGAGGIMDKLGMVAALPPRAIGMLRRFQSLARHVGR